MSIRFNKHTAICLPEPQGVSSGADVCELMIFPVSVYVYMFMMSLLVRLHAYMHMPRRLPRRVGGGSGASPQSSHLSQSCAQTDLRE